MVVELSCSRLSVAAAGMAVVAAPASLVPVHRHGTAPAPLAARLIEA